MLEKPFPGHVFLSRAEQTTNPSHNWPPHPKPRRTVCDDERFQWRGSSNR
jgi:hypothetical protein